MDLSKLDDEWEKKKYRPRHVLADWAMLSSCRPQQSVLHRLQERPPRGQLQKSIKEQPLLRYKWERALETHDDLVRSYLKREVSVGTVAESARRHVCDNMEQFPFAMNGSRKLYADVRA